MKLTREQKIDFLKCCIAAYEDKRLSCRIKYYNYGFCRMYAHYILVCIRKVSPDPFSDDKRIDDLKKYFPKLFKYIKGKGKKKDIYFFDFCNIGIQDRITVAREFLKKEYGIDYKK